MPLMPKMFNQPLMIEENYHRAMIAADINDLEKKAASFSSNRKNYIVKNNKAIIPIIGPLSQRLDFWSWLFGGASYDSIREDFNISVIDNDIEEIIFEIDSPGGGVPGAFDLIDDIYAARGKKKIIAMVNEAAYSAAYGIASAAHEIYIPRTGGAGSIGVKALHADLSKWEEKVGVKYTAIFAGARKNDFTPHEPLSEEAYIVAKAEVDAIYDIFIDTVSRNRGINAEIIRKMEAGIYQGQKAVDIGLADEIKTMTEVLNNTGGKRMSNKSLKVAISEVIKDAKSDELAKAMSELGYVEKEGMMLEADHAKAMEDQAVKHKLAIDETAKTAKTEGMEEFKKGTISILELCTIGGLEKLGLKMITDGISAEDAKKQIFAAKTPQQTINSTVHPLHTGEVNPLLADAERRAKEARV